MDAQVKKLWDQHREQWNLMLAAARRVQEAARLDESRAEFHAAAVHEFEAVHVKVTALSDEIKATIDQNIDRFARSMRIR